MRRIGLAIVLTLSVLAPPVAEAQAGKVYRIGFLGLPSAADTPEFVAAFRHRLRDLGYEEGKNISIEYR
jgi:aspartate aminotransferase-like enzyme